MRHVAHIALGANLGPRRATLRFALRALDQAEGVAVQAVSRWHVTTAVGGPPGQPRFVNGAARLETTRSPHDLLSLMLDIEARSGRVRVRAERDAPRTLDLDLLLFDDLVIDDERLVVPHPRLAERLFVLAPLCDIDPLLLVPGTGRTVAEQIAHLRSATSAIA